MVSRRAKRLISKALRLGVSYFVLIVMAAWSILPLYYIIMTSLSNVGTLVSLSLSDLVPKHPTLEAYRELLLGRFIPSLRTPNFPLWVAHSLELAAATALFSVALAMLAGYALSRLNIPAKSVLATFVYIITFLPTTATTVPLYLSLIHI